ncbi:hypothetical protein W97_08671 [Coniosporium apollinis CBS 100218]|uniref:Inner centromere protein ARK-binding domain-containing protein n=1 Tax=Coniosporium apollinis (strain CBS 100218) TaxID=1168221 RepID=R7Z650_CONA1|nr:uncharacterized protein W97_08671 [Coniosporium apollinis CBS 100218]EON69411.1 hypothetical protein W97_08671 [Coniosporium apollinis CBS 100218]
MASSRSKTQVGSAPWLLNERQQANELIEQEVEEFTYSVRNEMEWLNEHMAEIFTRNQLNVADIFKTPGKLRGKTPRTARKRNPLETRAPLTDIFGPNPQAEPSPAQETQFYKSVARFQVPDDANRAAPIAASPQNRVGGIGKENTDSGYHGTTDDEMELDRVPVAPRSPLKQQAPAVPDPAPSLPIEPAEEDHELIKEARRATKESFVSAEEDEGDTIPDEEVDIVVTNADAEEEGQEEGRKEGKGVSQQFSVGAETASAMNSILHEAEDVNDPMEVDGVRSPSEGSSPVKPLLRKSSLTFATLPAREPLASKQSIGNRVSRTSHLDQYKSSYRSSNLGRFTGGKSLGGSQHVPAIGSPDAKEHMDVDEENRPPMAREESETTRLHNKTSTQRLHERINMLGQAKETKDFRSSKSIPSSNPASQVEYAHLPASETEKPKPALFSQSDEQPRAAVVPATEDDDDDWIVPVVSTGAANTAPRPAFERSHSNKSQASVPDKAATETQDHAPYAPQKSPARAASPTKSRPAFGHLKSSSASVLPSPGKSSMAPPLSHKKTVSVSNPPLSNVPSSVTPVGSPMGKKFADGPLSASKAKFYSVLKSAKGIFASSAGASAQAKMEALSPAIHHTRSQAQAPQMNALLSPNAHTRPASTFYPEVQIPEHANSAPTPTRAQEGRKTRSSTEREEKRKEKEAKERQRAVDDLEKAREKERQKAVTQKQKDATVAAEEQALQQKAEPESRAENPPSHDEETDAAEAMPPPPPPKSLLPTANSQKPRGRLAKPTKNPSTALRPAAMSIKVPSQSFRQIPQPGSALPAESHDVLPPAVPSKQSSIASKQSTTSLQSASSTESFRTASSTQTRTKALEAAARKREQDERDAQRRAERQRELEQRRAAKQEEERRLEQQRKAAEELRKQEAKKAAQKAAETKRPTRQQQQVSRPQSRQANDLANTLQVEKTLAPPPRQRGDLGAARPVSRMNTMQEPPPARPVPQINPAKPPKRVFQPEDDDEPVQRPTLQRNPPSFKQLDAKRRKTIDEEEERLEEPRRSVMAPPMRPSNVIRKETRFPNGYTTAPPPAAHPVPHTQTLWKQTVNGQHQLQHPKPNIQPNDMAKISTAKIPFADAPNPAGPSASLHPPTYKTPARNLHPAAPNTAGPKSSPRYPASETIALPEIATDSEDEDSENEFSAPSWVASPALRELLQQQQLVDPAEIFGPIAELKMEEVFRNKDRHKRFRDRTSSANWNGADRLTEEERKRDREGRERLVRDGGWVFHETPEGKR